MRILIISNLFPPHSLGGYEERCKVVAAGLIARGHDVMVLTSRYGVEDETNADVSLHAGIPVARWLTPIGFFDFPWLRAHHLFRAEAANHRALRRSVDEFAPDIIHIWNMGGIGKDLITTAGTLAPVVCDISDHWPIRGLPSDPLRSWYDRHPLLARFLGHERAGMPGPSATAPKLINPYFTSKALRDMHVQAGLPVANAPVIYCGIDVPRYASDVQRRAHTDGKTLRCCFVGRLCADKGVRAACAGVVAAGDGVTLDVYGGGDSRYTASLYAEFGDHPRINFMGRRKPEELPQIYTQYDCLVFPSEWPEPFALTPLEAAAAGLAIAATATGGTPEFIRDGSNGRLWDAGDAHDLARVLQDYVRNPQQRLQLAAQAQRDVQQFNQQHMVAAIEETLSQHCRTQRLAVIA